MEHEEMAVLMRRQLYELRRENQELRAGAEQTVGMVDAILAQLVLTVAPEGKTLTIPRPTMAVLTEYQVSTEAVGDNYKITVTERAAQ